MENTDSSWIGQPKIGVVKAVNQTGTASLQQPSVGTSRSLDDHLFDAVSVLPAISNYGTISGGINISIAAMSHPKTSIFPIITCVINRKPFPAI